MEQLSNEDYQALVIFALRKQLLEKEYETLGKESQQKSEELRTKYSLGPEDRIVDRNIFRKTEEQKAE